MFIGLLERWLPYVASRICGTVHSIPQVQESTCIKDLNFFERIILRFIHQDTRRGIVNPFSIQSTGQIGNQTTTSMQPMGKNWVNYPRIIVINCSYYYNDSKLQRLTKMDGIYHRIEKGSATSSELAVIAKRFCQMMPLLVFTRLQKRMFQQGFGWHQRNVQTPRYTW
jgi:hypothetical protein